MVVYYVIKNQIVDSEKLLNSNFFSYQHFKVSREYYYYKYNTIQLELEALASFIMMDGVILKDQLISNIEVLETISRLNS